MGQPGAAKGKRKYKNNKDIQKKFRSKRRTRDHDQIRSDSQLRHALVTHTSTHSCFHEEGVYEKGSQPQHQ
jgi:hypothetical protein